MAKIDRKTQKIFAGQAGSKEITEFGTAKLATPIYTTNLDLIQNTNFLNGWSSAILADKSPWEEDMNALFFALTKQLAYLFQEGIAEYDENTTYYMGSLAKVVDNKGNITVYKSKINENTGNDVTDNNYWTIYQSESELGIASYEIGLPQPTFSNNLLSNEIWLEGQEVSRKTYEKLFAIYGTTYGTGDGSTTFNLPDCRNRVLWGATSFGYISAGLPNITGNIGRIDSGGGGGVTADGVFNVTGTWNTHGRGQNNSPHSNVNFNASRSSAIYGASSTVQPPAIKCRVKTRYI